MVCITPCSTNSSTYAYAHYLETAGQWDGGRTDIQECCGDVDACRRLRVRAHRVGDAAARKEPTQVRGQQCNPRVGSGLGTQASCRATWQQRLQSGPLPAFGQSDTWGCPESMQRT